VTGRFIRCLVNPNQHARLGPVKPQGLCQQVLAQHDFFRITLGSGWLKENAGDNRSGDW